MRKLFALVLTLCLLTGCALSALADDDRLITVIGMATVSVPADLATVNLGVSTMDLDVQRSAALNAEKINAVVFALQELGIPEADISTANYYMDTLYDYNSMDEGGYVVRGYQVNNTVTVTVRELELVGQVVDTALRAGANQVNGLSFLSTLAAEACDEAFKAAIQEAGRKAALAAEAGGVKLGKLHSINESYGSYGGVEVKAEATMDFSRAAGNTRFLANGLDCSATVNVSYEIDD